VSVKWHDRHNSWFRHFARDTAKWFWKSNAPRRNSIKEDLKDIHLKIHSICSKTCRKQIDKFWILAGVFFYQVARPSGQRPASSGQQPAASEEYHRWTMMDDRSSIIDDPSRRWFLAEDGLQPKMAPSRRWLPAEDGSQLEI